MNVAYEDCQVLNEPVGGTGRRGEATSAVDTETERLLQRSIADPAADRTTVAIAHRLSTGRGADRIVAVRNGGIVERGTHATTSCSTAAARTRRRGGSGPANGTIYSRRGEKTSLAED